ncbi:MAG: LysR family transcriptional regulator [Cryobacterium sp.]|uniref:LysR family transcriptional regulator n=1 Tax=unclassified Cryobacterium TaxID=2649013 RepID=UPI0018C90607|nr:MULTISPECIES: LysR family transcriptional regulator [unclassified Cryobacterium]MCY7403096.1 LysR family transcriptional regulator [Cryobacterium sp.]MEC5152783.1 DNA-binding transcriptional LysR family regulator [Cryobacterium sp. CAN_C3]
MTRPDLNLLVTLDVLLQEGNVTRAGERLNLSPSAMSRALARLRMTTGDPLLVRAGRGLVPTPHALELRERVGQLVQEAEAALGPPETVDLAGLVKTFTLRTSDGFVESFGPDLVSRVCEKAPGVRLRFMQKVNTDVASLRDGTTDLEIGVVDKTNEVRTEPLFTDHFVGVIRMGHPLTRARITPVRYASGSHIRVSRRGVERGAIDDALRPYGMERQIAVIVGGFAAALALARTSDLIATVPERHTSNLRADMHTFPLPFPTPEITVSMLWHPRLEVDPAHRWLRACVRRVCTDSDVGVTLASPKALS